MSVENPRTPDSQYRDADTDQRSDICAVAARVEEWLTESSKRPEQPEALDENPRHRDVVNPSATRIGRSDRPDATFSGADAPETDDIGERLRRLHAERDAPMAGNDQRREQLDIARITQAICNTLDLTTWERDRVLGVVCELDREAFEDRHTIPRVVVVLARRVVDAERRAWLGLDDSDQPPERLQALASRLHRLTDSDQYDRLLDDCTLSTSGIDQIETTLTRTLDEETVQEAAFGRSPYRDPALPPFEHRANTTR